MIRLEKASVIFYPDTPDESVALRSCGLEIREGDFITIIGTNGAGKSTLFNVISGHSRLSSGKIYYNGEDISSLSEYKRAKIIGRIFQDPSLGTAAHMSLEDNLIVAREKGMRGLRISLSEKTRGEFRESLKQLDMGLEHRLSDNVGLFSGGQRQAVALLMMVLSSPKLILLDEHTAALDPRNAAQVLDLTAEFITRYQLTAMMITHNMQQAIDYGNRLLMMDRGRIVLDIDGPKKNALTPQQLIDEFHKVCPGSLASDESLLI